MLLRLGFSVLSEVAGPKYKLQTYYLAAPQQHDAAAARSGKKSKPSEEPDK